MNTVKTLIVICMLILSRAHASDLILPKCPDQAKLVTEVYFYIDNDILTEYSTEFVESKIDSWTKYANLTLSNSCVPMTRVVSKIEYLSEIDSSWFQDEEAAIDLLTYYLEEQLPENNDAGVPIFKAILFANYSDSFKSEWCGVASRSRDFFIMALNCSDSTMEHEIGHLSGAQHDRHTLLKNDPQFELDTFLESRYPRKITRYAFGTVCSNRGTIMSYEKDQIPAYSSPDIVLNGESCGDSDTANNAQVMRNFAIQYGSSH